MNKGFGVDVFDPGDQLISQKKDRLERELPVAEVEEVLQTWSQQIQHHGIVVTFCTKPTNEWNANPSGQRLVDASFVFELRMLGFDTLQLDGNFFPRDDVRSCFGISDYERL